MLAALSCTFFAALLSQAQSQSFIDSTFSTPGFYSSAPGNSDLITATAIQPNGKILVSGVFVAFNGSPSSNLIRLHANGEKDASFDPTAKTNGTINIIGVQNDGRILLGGSFTSFKNLPINNNLIRLKEDGTWDSTFTPPAHIRHGMVALIRIAQQADGKILVCGTNVKSYSSDTYQIIRLNTNGTLDVSFNVDPKLAQFQNISKLTPLPDGKLWVSGDFSSFGGKPYKNLVRLNNNGSIDTTFQLQGQGFLNQNMTQLAPVSALLPMPDGGLLAGGSFYYCGNHLSPGVVRIKADGTVDPSFGTNYSFLPLGLDHIDTVDGKLLIGGSFYFQGWQGMVLRLNANGSLDQSFDRFPVDASTRANFGLNTLSVLPDKSLLMTGSFNFFHRSVPFSGLARLSPNGSPDTSMHTNFQKIGVVYKTLVTKDGKILVGGSFDAFGNMPVHNLVRLLPSGGLDASFQVAYGPDNAVTNIAEAEDSSIIITGDFKNINGHNRNSVARLRPDGTLDAGFEIGSGPDPFGATAVLPLPDGKVVVGGPFSTFSGYASQGIVRLMPDGAIDTSFRAPANAPWYSAGSIASFSNGQLLIGDDADHSQHNYSLPLRVWKLQSNGSIDPSFQTTAQGGYPITYGLAVDGKDRIYVYNRLLRPSPSNPGGEIFTDKLLQLNPDGSNHANSINYPAGFYLRSFEATGDSAILVSGTYLGVSDSIRYVLRLKSDLSIDSSYNPVTLFYDIKTLHQMPDGRVLVGGEPIRFFRFDVEQIPNVAVLNSTALSVVRNDTLVQNTMGLVVVNSDASGTKLVIKNTGSSLVRFDAGSQNTMLLGADATAFELDKQQMPSVLTRNDSAVLYIRMKANAAVGSKQARLVIPFENGVKQQYSFALQGTIAANQPKQDTAVVVPPPPPSPATPPTNGTPESHTIGPNPNHGTLYIQSSLPQFDLYVYNPSGRLIYRARQLAGNQRTTVHLGKLTPGVYWVQLKGVKETVTKQLVIF